MTQVGGLTWPDAGERAGAGCILAIPLGSTEQHGPHLPLSTDTDIAVALCAGLARRRDDVVLAPAFPYGASGEHQSFPGTLSIGHAALEFVLIELVRSASATFARTLLVSAHGGNAATVHRAAEQLRSEGRDVRVWMPPRQGDAHAGRVETSLQLALDPRRVRLNRAEPGNVAPLEELMPMLQRAGIAAVNSNGVLGDPSGASAAEGQALLERLAADLAGEVAAWTAGEGKP
jgi:mycofactocin precursor peptide peptidase